MKSKEILYIEFYRRVYFFHLTLESCMFCGRYDQYECYCSNQERSVTQWLNTYNIKELWFIFDIFNEWCQCNKQQRRELIDRYNIDYPGFREDMIRFVDEENFDNIEENEVQDKDSQIDIILIPDIILTLFRNYILQNPLNYQYYYGWFDSDNNVQRLFSYWVMCQTKDGSDKVFSRIPKDWELFEQLQIYGCNEFSVQTNTFSKVLEELINSHQEEAIDFVLKYTPADAIFSIPLTLKIKYKLKNSIFQNLCSETTLQNSSFDDYKELTLYLFKRFEFNFYKNLELVDNISNRFKTEFIKFLSEYITSTLTSFESFEFNNTMDVHIILYLNQRFSINPMSLIDSKHLNRFILSAIQTKPNFYFLLLVEFLDGNTITSEFSEIINLFTKSNDPTCYCRYLLFTKISKEFAFTKIETDIFIEIMKCKFNIFSVAIFLQYFDVNNNQFQTFFPKFEMVDYIQYMRKDISLIQNLFTQMLGQDRTISVMLYCEMCKICVPSRDTEELQFLKDNVQILKEVLRCQPGITDMVSTIFCNSQLCKILFSTETQSGNEIGTFLAQKVFYNHSKTWNPEYLLFLGKFHNMDKTKMRLILLCEIPLALDLLYSVGDDGISYIINNSFQKVYIEFLDSLFSKYAEDGSGPPPDLPKTYYQYAELLLRSSLDFLKRPVIFSNDLYSGLFLNNADLAYKFEKFISLYPFCYKSKLFMEWYNSIPILIKSSFKQTYITYKLDSILQRDFSDKMDLDTKNWVFSNYIYQKILTFSFLDKTLHSIHKFNLSKVSKLFLVISKRILSYYSKIGLNLKNEFGITQSLLWSLGKNYSQSQSIYNLAQSIYPIEKWEDFIENLDKLDLSKMSTQYCGPLLKIPLNVKTIKILYTPLPYLLSLAENCPNLEVISLYIRFDVDGISDYLKNFYKSLSLLHHPKLKNIEIKMSLQSDKNLQFEDTIRELKSQPFNVQRLPCISVSVGISNWIFSGIDCIEVSMTAISRLSYVESHLDKCITTASLENTSDLRLKIPDATQVFQTIDYLQNQVTFTKPLERLSLHIENIISPNEIFPEEQLQQIFDKLDSLKLPIKELYLFYAVNINYKIPMNFHQMDTWSQISLHKYKTNNYYHFIRE
ncbi:hypothetical protein DLAC_05964 [Tieghemostelium lacteum]|uniref:Uncharacterized protein n=1 Tax=Tieghemostelium lacteum TaxID=361077 RepID=A0A151ZHE7_TIELA|nr:hypothetical protein DLAC_05964 [Tieghemostelium lacteum]|eukprot:KYQ93300.1 hypothetical protein DLAC_05964 [Tieghemostelium lacteum]